MKKNVKEEIRKAVEQISIKTKSSTEGHIQREAFRIRWGKKPEEL